MNEFTIFITSYNYGHFIGRAIESVVKQTHPGWNLYILDNGSTDNTFDIVEPYLADPRIRLIKRPVNIGSAQNITRGFLDLEGTYISTLAADDWLEPIFVEKALEAFSGNPGIPLAAFGWMAYVESDETFVSPHTIPYPKSFSGRTCLSPHLTLGNFIPVHLIAFRKSTIDFIFKEMLEAPLRQMGEQYVIKRLEDRYGPSFFSSEVVGYWRRHEAQQTFSNANSYASGIENVLEPLLYVQGDTLTNKYTRFLSLVQFLSVSSRTPHRHATEWLLGESGQHFASNNGIEIGPEADLYRCIACALMLGHHTLGASQFITADEIHRWLEDLLDQTGLNPAQILAIANNAYDGFLYPGSICELIVERLGQSGFKPRTAMIRRASDIPYDQWLPMRDLLPEDARILAEESDRLSLGQTRFHFILRLQPGGETHLAETIDSLAQQYLPTWHLDILTSLPSPEGLDNIPCIGWHTVANQDQTKDLIDALVDANQADWLLEIPAGARFDLLFLWRMALEAKKQPEALAFFVDDDCFDTSNQRHSPRFKPGCNPASLQSADLAGPLCLSQVAWQATGAAFPAQGSPWFSRLLRVADTFGWHVVKHVPDILISYADEFPSDTTNCLLALIEHQKSNGRPCEIVPATGQSWNIRYALTNPPAATIAILSQGHLDLLGSCFYSTVSKTIYANFEILVLCPTIADDAELAEWLIAIQQSASRSVRVIQSTTLTSHAARCNAAINAARHDFVLLIREEAQVIQSCWLEELMRTCVQPDIAAVSPRLIQPGTGLIENAGDVIGLLGNIGAPYRGEAKPGDSGYLDSLQIARDVSTLPAACMMVRKASYLAVGGMDEGELGDHLPEADLSLKLRANAMRLLYQPMSTVLFGGTSHLELESDQAPTARDMLLKTKAGLAFHTRWKKEALLDPYWNPNFSLAAPKPTLEADYRAPWQYLPADSPRLFAHSLTNGQGVYRVVAPLRAARKASLALDCVWLQRGTRQPTAAELERMAPDTAIVQHYLYDRHLSSLHAWKVARISPFIVYTIDDLITDMDELNPSRGNIPANSRSRLKYALAHCDRLVTSTSFLADYCKRFIADIRVVPNRLDPEIWLPLTSQKRTTPRPRVGWAGGQSHLRDLLVLKEVIERTRHEVDWVFFGMCPDEIRPFLAEYHPFSNFSTYPAHLASLNLDLAVAPLAQTPFNQAKSNLRLLEYGVLGIPVICTNIDPYRDSPACCVTNTPDAWIEALRSRIYDADAREREGTAIKSWVTDHFLLQGRHLKSWLEAHLPT